MTILIKNWYEYQKRTYKGAKWFSLSNVLFNDEKMWRLTNNEKIVWIYILCESSLKAKESYDQDEKRIEGLNLEKKDKLLWPYLIDIDIEFGAYKTNTEVNEFSKTIEKIEKLNIINTSKKAIGQYYAGLMPDFCRTRAYSCSKKASTLHNTTLHNNTLHDITLGKEKKLISTKAATSHPLISNAPDNFHSSIFDLWAKQDVFPKINKLSESRIKKAKAQWKKYPNISHWEQSLQKFINSEFVNTKWNFNIDSFLSEDKRLKSLDCVYDDILKSKMKTKEQLISDSNAALLREVNAESEVIDI